MTDLIVRLEQRDEEALECLKIQYGGECYGLLFSLLRSREEAEEALNDVWLRIWNGIPPAKPHNLRAYLLATCRNVALDYIKYREAAKRKAVQVLLDELAELLPDPAASLQEERAFLRDCLNRFLHGLSEKDRRLFLRRYWYGDTTEELSRKTGISVSAIESRLFRTRKKLKKFLEKEGYTL